jgi:hypothetical protein
MLGARLNFMNPVVDLPARQVLPWLSLLQKETTELIIYKKLMNNDRVFISRATAAKSCLAGRQVTNRVKIAFLIGIFGTFLVPASALAGSSAVIKDNGTISVTSAKVMMIAGTTIYTRLYWGDSFIRVLVKTDEKTRIVRRFGEVTSIKEIKEGDMLDIEGTLETGGGTSLNIIPTFVRNQSVEKIQNSYSGTVTEFVATSAYRGFTLYTKSQGIMTVAFGTSTVVTKGSRTIDLQRIKVGDTVTSVEGEYDFKTKILSARRIVIYFDKNTLLPQTFEGVLRELPKSTVTPTSMIVGIKGLNYRIEIPSSARIWNTARATTSLSRFVAGDTIRILGALREADDPIIDANIIRNINL